MMEKLTASETAKQDLEVELEKVSIKISLHFCKCSKFVWVLCYHFTIVNTKLLRWISIKELTSENPVSL